MSERQEFSGTPDGGPLRLEPLGAMGLYDVAINLFRHDWGRWLALSTVGTLPVAMLTLGHLIWLGRITADTPPEVYWDGLTWWSVAMTAAWCVQCVARSALTALVLASSRGLGLEVGDAWRRARAGIPAALFVGLVGFALPALLGLLGLFPGALLAAAWWVARPVMINEGEPYGAAIRRSWQLTRPFRGRAVNLLVAHFALWLLFAVNLHLVIGFVLQLGESLLAMETTHVRQLLTPRNLSYLGFLAMVGFVVLDPLKSAVDVLLYLDIRVRRHGADLEERLAHLARGLGVILCVLLLARPAGAISTEEYVRRLQAVRERVHAAESADDLPRGVAGNIRSQLVRSPDGNGMTVENQDLATQLHTWKTPAEKQALLDRIDALTRSVGPVEVAPGSSSPAGAAAGDARSTMKSVLTEIEFQPLADRPEVRDLLRDIQRSARKSWWDSFVEWFQKNIFKPPQFRLPPPPNLPLPTGGWDLGWLLWVALAALAALLLWLIVLLVRMLIERPVQEAAARAIARRPTPPAGTDNALDHTVDEWEQFAREWMRQGDVRQGVRALYLATLVHLHEQRRIEYNRAFTNWIYVRQFRGEGGDRDIFAELTRVFDRVWYGEREIPASEFDEVLSRARALGTPSPPGVHASA